jgi:hypothetical protein
LLDPPDPRSDPEQALVDSETESGPEEGLSHFHWSLTYRVSDRFQTFTIEREIPDQVASKLEAGLSSLRVFAQSRSRARCKLSPLREIQILSDRILAQLKLLDRSAKPLALARRYRVKQETVRNLLAQFERFRRDPRSEPARTVAMLRDPLLRLKKAAKRKSQTKPSRA